MFKLESMMYRKKPKAMKSMNSINTSKCYKDVQRNTRQCWYQRGASTLFLAIVTFLLIITIIIGNRYRVAKQKRLPGGYLTRDSPQMVVKMPSICDLKSISNPINLTTLVIMSYTNNDALMMVLSQYNDCTLFGGIIYEIVIVWNNPSLKFNFSHTSLCIDNETHIIPIHIYQQPKNSMANRWFIASYHNFKTSSAVFIDDDMFINQYSISCMLQTFLRNPSKIIAPSHTHLRTTRQLEKDELRGKDPETGRLRWEYVNNWGTKFNMLLPGMSMFNTNYLPKLASTLTEYDLLDIIDNQIAHCDDISMMLSMAMINNGERYLLGIDYILIGDYSSFRKNQAALTDKSQIEVRYSQRSECLTMIMNKFIIHNKSKRKIIINPIVHHERGEDTLDCQKCEWCDHRACWYRNKEYPEDELFKTPQCLLDKTMLNTK